MKDEVTLTGYRFSITYKEIEYELGTDVCFEPYLYDGSIKPNPEYGGHTPMEISDFVQEAILN